MGTRSFDFLTESLLFHHDYLDNCFENVAESTLRKTLEDYRNFCDRNVTTLRNELAKTNLTVFSGLGRSAGVQSIAQSAFYLDQYILDDPLYRLSIPERPMNSIMNEQIGMSQQGDIRKAVSKAAQHMKRHSPFVAANYVKFLPLTQPQEPTIPIQYSETFFSDVLPETLLQFFYERAQVRALGPVSEGFCVIDEPLRPTRRISVTFGDEYERAGIYVLQQTKPIAYDDETGVLKCILHIPDSPPDESDFNAWVFQSVNQTAHLRYNELLQDAMIAADLGAQYVATKPFDFELLQQLLGRRRTLMTTNCIPVDLTVIEDIDATTLMRIRQEESDAFQCFRDSLNTRLSELRAASDINSLEKHAQVVVGELKEEARALGSVLQGLKKKFLWDVAIATSTLVAGVQSSGFTVAALAPALVLGARSWNEYRTQVRLNPAFFLWKLLK